MWLWTASSLFSTANGRQWTGTGVFNREWTLIDANGDVLPGMDAGEDGSFEPRMDANARE